MDSMNPGKAVAQGAHAANQFVKKLPVQDLDVMALYEQWETSTPDGFGTTITLGVDDAMLHGAVEFAQKAGYHAMITTDPTYPLMDGKTLFLIPVDTCGFIFGDRDELRPLLKQFNLHP